MLNIEVKDKLIFIRSERIKKEFGPNGCTVINRFDIQDVIPPIDETDKALLKVEVTKNGTTKLVTVYCDNVDERYLLEAALVDELEANKSED